MDTPQCCFIMAEAADTGMEQVECGFCSRKDEALHDPKVLPCSHAHCLECLQGYRDIYEVVQCPLESCRELYDMTLETLPSADIKVDNSIFCQICTKMGIQNVEAITYCTNCSESYCVKHQELHDVFHEDHERVTMDEYRSQRNKLEKRTCKVHNKLLYSVGCAVCLTVFCAECVLGLDCCTDGSSHKLTPISDLVSDLKKEIDEMKSKVIDKKDRLSALFKQVSKIMSDYDIETEHLIKTLHSTRDEQLNTIRLKYERLENEFVELRKVAKSEMKKFMEENVGVKLFDVNKYRLRTEARLENSHQVDLVIGHKDTKDEMQSLISEDMPQLGVKDVISVEVKGEKRDVEVEVVSSGGLSISFEHGLETLPALPKSLTLTKTVEVSSNIHSICHYQGNTYAGTENGFIDKIDINNQLTKSFITVNNRPSGVVVHKDQIYTLVRGSPYKVHVHDLRGNPITSWSYTDSNMPFNKLVVVNNQIVIPDRQNKRLCIYSLTGEVIKNLPCPQLNYSTVALCSAGNNAVIISDYSSSKVFKMNISTGEVNWTSTHVSQPQGVAFHRNKYVFVTNLNTKTTIWILDADTGNFLYTITDPTERGNSDVFDLHITEQILIVPRYDTREVMFYKME